MTHSGQIGVANFGVGHAIEEESIWIWYNMTDAFYKKHHKGVQSLSQICS